MALIPSKGFIMEWFHSNEREQERSKSGLATTDEIRSAFAEQRHRLYWIALLITGDDTLADLAVVNARALSANHSSVFRDWLNGWATYATVRAAIREVHGLIAASAHYLEHSSSDHPDGAVLSDDQVASLRQVDPQEIIVALDPLARSALVLRGIQHASIADSALLLGVPSRVVAVAYGQALRWNSEHTDTHRALNNHHADSRV